jgi:hypothetical protein
MNIFDIDLSRFVNVYLETVDTLNERHYFGKAALLIITLKPLCSNFMKNFRGYFP